MQSERTLTSKSMLRGYIPLEVVLLYMLALANMGVKIGMNMIAVSIILQNKTEVDSMSLSS